LTAQEYIKAEMDAGRLTLAHIEALVREFQDDYNLADDGKPGPATREVIERMYKSLFPKPEVKLDPHDTKPFLSNPLPLLKPTGSQRPTVRKAVITSGFHARNPSRPTHNGVDFFYAFEDGDEPKFVGDGGAAGDAHGNPKWVVPYNTYAQAAADGVVQIAGPSKTGFRVWIDHGNGLRSGYFHLLNLCVMPGSKITKGGAVGMVGHNPEDTDARHLHFEVSPVEKYEPLDPERYLIK
jgi:murein DD-endopeptidase MepM/ murein hydrolase activator NlpD